MGLLRNFNYNVLDAFLTSSVTGNTQPLFIGLGKPTPWPVDDTPVEPTQTDYDAQEVVRNLLSVKRVTSQNYAFLINREVWTTGTVYEYYDSEDEQDSETKFYVINSSGDVFKCIWNNGGLPSTSEPQSQTEQLIITADDYVWKYIYTLSPTSDGRFGTTQYIPVTANTTITESAIPGTIDYAIVVDSGNNYISTHSSTISNVVSSNVYGIGSTANTLVSFYANSAIYITSGTGVGSLSRITDSYTNSSGNFIRTQNPMNLATDSPYLISPSVSFNGDGQGAEGYATIANNKISSVILTNNGNNYTYCDATVGGSIGYSTPARLRCLISPANGHGSDPVSELRSGKLSFNMVVADNTVDLPDYRQISLINNVKYANGTLLTTSSSMVSTFNVSNNEVFEIGSIIEGLTSNTKGVVVASNTTVARVHYTSGSFQNNEIVTDGSSTSLISNTSNRSIQRNSPEVLYYTNEEAINRSNTINEFIKFTINFS